jgi:ATP-binding cassette subfamily C protein CydC
MQTIINLMRPHLRRFVVAAAFGALTILASVFLALASSWLIAMAALRPAIFELNIAIVGVRGLGIGRAVFRYLERLTGHDATFRLLADLRVRFYQRIEPLSGAQLSAKHSGDLLARVIADVETLQNVYLRAIGPFAVAILVGIVTSLLISSFNLLAGLVATGLMVLGGVAVPLWAHRQGRYIGKTVVIQRAALTTGTIKLVQGMADALAYGLQSKHLTDLNDRVRQVRAAESSLARLDGWVNVISALLSGGALLLVLWLTINHVAGIWLAALALAAQSTFEAFQPLTQAAQQWGMTEIAATRLFEAQPVPPSNGQGVPTGFDLHIEGLTFGYEPALPVVHDLTLDIPYGTHIVFVSPSGGGKSTLLSLLTALLTPQQGVIRLGGQDLHTLDPDAVRAVMGVLPQRMHLFNTTLGENIRLAHPDASDSDLIEAARLAQIHDAITALPDSYESLLGEDGAKFSGGQRQRVALARVFLRNAPIWILDEPTAALDHTTAAQVMREVKQAAHGHTLIVLLHDEAQAEGISFDKVVRLKQL